MSDSVTNLGYQSLMMDYGTLGYLLQNKLPRLSEKFGQLSVSVKSKMATGGHIKKIEGFKNLTSISFLTNLRARNPFLRLFCRYLIRKYYNSVSQILPNYHS